MKIVKRLLEGLRHRKTLEKLFDRDYYGAPFLHFIAIGAFEGRSPHPLFDSTFYLRKYPDVAASGMNPLLHYLMSGARERRKPHPLFEPEYYLARCVPARTSALDPLMHFLPCRGEECCSPHPLFDCEAYRAAHPEVRNANPLVHYLKSRREFGYEAGCLRLEILDVTVAIVFAGQGGVQTTPSGCVTVWEDFSGRMQFIAPPQQRPFFQSLSYDQLRAQV